MRDEGVLREEEKWRTLVELWPGFVVILDGKTPHAVLLELFTNHGAGTLIRR